MLADAATTRRRRPRRRALLALTLVTAALALVATALVTEGGVPASAKGPRITTRFSNFGVTSSAILTENRLSGTTAWRIGPGVSSTAIQGFANVTYAAAGQKVRLYVDSRSPTFTAVAYRMGWYQGLGARMIWKSLSTKSHAQPACTVAASTNMVSCANWRPSLTMAITSAFVPGDYLIKLNAGARAASYVQLTVWNPTSTAAYVIMNRSLVEQGWNTYGGYSFYAGIGKCILDNYSYPVCNRARVVSFDRPYNSGQGASDFLTNEYPLVRFCEHHGLDVTYITDITLSQHPSLLLRHRALLSLDHDETWTYAERMAVVHAVAHGVNVVYFGAAAMVRHVRLQSSPLGPDRQEVDYRNAAEDPLNGVGSPMQVTGNTWASPPTNWPPISQIGVNYSGYLNPGVFVPMVISDPASWVFKGTSLKRGSSLPGVIGSDFDHVISSSLTPPNIEILAHSPIPVSDGTVSGSVWNGLSYSDMVYFTNPQSKAGVIDTGNNIWIGDLQACPRPATRCPASTLEKITANILKLFGRGPAGRFQPSHSNLAHLQPLGS